MKYILRFQHPISKKGPYCHLLTPNLEASLDLEYLQDRPLTMPAINDDLLNRKKFKYGTHVCGVEYMSHLYEWFGKNLEKLRAAGFMLYLYLVPAEKVLHTHSNMQVAFDPKDAISVEIL
jgi:hypothetical protein